MRDQLTQERFEKDIVEHKMEILREDGVYRHIRFGKPGSSEMHFDLTTWPGYLCYTGDMGTYVFQRVHDMFDFFRRPEHCRYSIDMRYWAEKVEAGDKCSSGNGITEFSENKAIAEAWRQVDAFIKEELPVDDEEGTAEQRDLLRRAAIDLRVGVSEMLGSADSNDVRFYDALNDFSFHQGDSEAWKELELESFEFSDVWEWDMQDYTHRFKWCCMALSWAMQTYDKHVESQVKK